MVFTNLRLESNHLKLQKHERREADLPGVANSRLFRPDCGVNINCRPHVLQVDLFLKIYSSVWQFGPSRVALCVACWPNNSQVAGSNLYLLVQWIWRKSHSRRAAGADSFLASCALRSYANSQYYTMHSGGVDSMYVPSYRTFRKGFPRFPLVRGECRNGY
jgi:hypothetical protein